MGEQVKELFNWARQRKLLAAFFVSLTLVIGILIGSLVSGRVSATRGSFAGTDAGTGRQAVNFLAFDVAIADVREQQRPARVLGENLRHGTPHGPKPDQPDFQLPSAGGFPRGFALRRTRLRQQSVTSSRICPYARADTRAHHRIRSSGIGGSVASVRFPGIGSASCGPRVNAFQCDMIAAKAPPS